MSSMMPCARMTVGISTLHLETALVNLDHEEMLVEHVLRITHGGNVMTSRPVSWQMITRS